MSVLYPSKWSAYIAAKAAIFAAGGLKNIATTAGAISGAIDNTAGDQLADLELLIDLATAATVGGYVSLWFIKTIDGTNYESGSATVFPARAPDVIIPVRSTTDDSQVVAIGPILWPQGKFTVVFQNNTGQTTTNTDNLTQLSYRSYNSNMVAP
jgi:hypothetical protein